jgi:hypothetical protein
MKKYLLIFVALTLLGTIYLSFPLSTAEHFVTLKNKKFQLDGKEFYPVTLNYMVSIQTDEKELWPCSFISYNDEKKYRFTTKDSNLLQLKAEMDLIKEMGFNSIRIAGIGEVWADEKTGELSIGASIGNQSKATIKLSNEENYNKYFNALNELFDIADKAGLKVVFLNKVYPGVNSSVYHLRKVVSRFKDKTAIMAYDFYNEPLYFDKPERNKNEVSEIVKEWKRIVEMYAPNQLCTIGLVGMREVFEWDPNLLDVDFISFHPYNVENDQVMNEIYWYNQYVKKPWIIGETAISADNDSVSYEEQKLFARKTLKQAYNCNAIGYSWWQYKDVEWNNFHANYLGVVSAKGETKTAKKNIIVKGTPKPVVDEFKRFNPLTSKGTCLCPSNYYNYPQHTQFRISGILKDDKDRPILGGVVLAWNQWWTKSYHTVSKEDGSFELYGDFPFYHWMASASMYSMVRGDVLPDSAKEGSDKIPTINLGNLKIEAIRE